MLHVKVIICEVIAGKHLLNKRLVNDSLVLVGHELVLSFYIPKIQVLMVDIIENITLILLVQICISCNNNHS